MQNVNILASNALTNADVEVCNNVVFLFLSHHTVFYNYVSTMFDFLGYHKIVL